MELNVYMMYVVETFLEVFYKQTQQQKQYHAVSHIRCKKHFERTAISNNNINISENIRHFEISATTTKRDKKVHLNHMMMCVRQYSILTIKKRLN